MIKTISTVHQKIVCIVNVLSIKLYVPALKILRRDSEESKSCQIIYIICSEARLKV